MVDSELIKKKYIKVDKNDHISHLLGQLKEHNAKAALVYDGKTFLGLADTHVLIRSKINPTEMKVSKLVVKVPLLKGSEDINEVARLMFTSNSKLLPVMDGDEVIGVVNEMDVLLELRNTDFARKRVADFMSTNLILIHENDRLGKAIEIMKKGHISRLPIVDSDGNLTKIVSLNDLLFNFILTHPTHNEARGRGSVSTFGHPTTRAFKGSIDFDAFPISSVTSSIIVTALKDDNLERTLDKMERFDIRSIVIVDGKKPVGILTSRDLLKLLIKE